ncbi:hypothetical protein GCM10027073_52410 [Streptomyces chlorus]
MDLPVGSRNSDEAESADGPVRDRRKADHFLAFTSIACTLICYRRLTK